MNFPEKKYTNRDAVDKLIELTRESIDDVMDVVDSKATKQNAIYNVSYDRVNGVINQITGTNFSSPVVGVDSTPTKNSLNLVTSGGVKDALDNIQPSVSEITAQQVDTLWDSIIPPPTEFTSNVQASTNSVDDGDFGTATQET